MRIVLDDDSKPCDSKSEESYVCDHRIRQPGTSVVNVCLHSLLLAWKLSSKSKETSRSRHVPSSRLPNRFFSSPRFSCVTGSQWTREICPPFKMLRAFQRPSYPIFSRPRLCMYQTETSEHEKAPFTPAPATPPHASESRTRKYSRIAFRQLKESCLDHPYLFPLFATFPVLAC